MICSIHQPNFFPWLGYFDKIARADVFVFLNQVDYEKSGHSMQCYTNRVGILRNEKPTWIHCPVVREHGPQAIYEVKINNELKWRDTLKDRINESYKTALYYKDMEEFIFALVDYETDYLSEYNIHNLEQLVKLLELKTKLVRQDMFHTTTHSTELLIELTKRTNCDAYLYGGGGIKYQNNELFIEQGINLISQNFEFPVYQQISQSFVSGLSILDTLFHCGVEKTKEMLSHN